MEKCYCGTGKLYSECCEPFISGKKLPANAEELLRSRYSAYAVINMDYILETTSEPQKKLFDVETNKRWAEESQWKQLQIISTEEKPETGICNIEFVAHYFSDGIDQKHHEKAEFKKYDDRWYFDGGQAVKTQPYVRKDSKVGLNSKCPCGSGKKFKKCCAGKE
ncbi:YchJ family protein [bacterium]|nr:YchJ family protein [bacterium]